MALQEDFFGYSDLRERDERKNIFDPIDQAFSQPKI